LSSVYYTSTQRILAGGSLDLVGLSGQSLGDFGGTGGSLTAGDITAVGNLQVQGQATFAQGVNVAGNLSATGGTSLQTTSIGGALTATGAATFQDSSNSTTAFQVQNSTGSNLITVDTINSIT